MDSMEIDDREFMPPPRSILPGELLLAVKNETMPMDEKIPKIRELVKRCRTKEQLDDRCRQDSQNTAFFIACEHESNPLCLVQIMHMFWQTYKDLANKEKFALSDVLWDGDREKWNPFVSAVDTGNKQVLRRVLMFYQEAGIFYDSYFMRQMTRAVKPTGKEDAKKTKLAKKTLRDFMKKHNIPRREEPPDAARPRRGVMKDVVVSPDSSSPNKRKKVSNPKRRLCQMAKCSNNKENETESLAELAPPAPVQDEDAGNEIIVETVAEEMNSSDTDTGSTTRNGNPADQNQSNNIVDKDKEMREFLIQCLSMPLSQLVPALQQKIADLTPHHTHSEI